MANKQSPFQNVRVVFQPGNPKLKKRLIALILASMLALGALAFVHHRIQVRTQALLEEAAALEQENRELQEKINALGSVQSVQDIAREELGLVDPNTVMIQPEE